MLLCRRGSTFISKGNKRLWIHSELRKIRLDQGKSPKKSPIRTDGPNDPMSQSTSVGVSCEFYTEKRFKATHCGDWSSLTEYSSQKFTIILNFLRVPQR